MHSPLELDESSPLELDGSASLRLSEQLVLLRRVSKRLAYLPGEYLLRGNTILSLDHSPLHHFLGHVLVVEEARITTLVAGKLAITTLRHNEQGERCKGEEKGNREGNERYKEERGGNSHNKDQD